MLDSVLPGRSVTLYCLEYAFAKPATSLDAMLGTVTPPEAMGPGAVWVKNVPCIAGLIPRNQKSCANPADIPVRADLSNYYDLSIRKVNSPRSGLVYTLTVNEEIQPFLGLEINVDEIPEGYNSWTLLWDESMVDTPSRCGSEAACIFRGGRTYVMWSLVRDDFNREQKCVVVSAPYFEVENVCVPINY
jgi:hypothetical protein